MNSEHRNKLLAEEALNSLDGIQRAAPRPFFYTRLSGRMQNTGGVWERAARFLSRPAIAIACVLVVLLVNAALLLDNNKGSEPVEPFADDFTTAGVNTTTALLFDVEQVNTEP